MATRLGSAAEPIERYPILGSFGGDCAQVRDATRMPEATGASRASVRIVASPIRLMSPRSRWPNGTLYRDAIIDALNLIRPSEYQRASVGRLYIRHLVEVKDETERCLH